MEINPRGVAALAPMITWRRQRQRNVLDETLKGAAGVTKAWWITP